VHALLDQENDILVIGEVDDGVQLLDQVAELRPDVVVVDLKMPNLNGLDAAEEIKRRFPLIHTVVLTMYADPAYIDRALQAGVCGYVLKEENIQELCTAIRNAARGSSYMSSVVAKTIPGLTDRNSDTPSQVKPLTAREREVLQMVAEGKTNHEAARILGISVRTVESHRAHLISKLNLKTRVDFVRYAMKHGIHVED
jgi:DNA-binding NarL/FixJ family response regulator